MTQHPPQAITTTDPNTGQKLTLTVGYLSNTRTLALFIGDATTPILIDADAVIEALTIDAD